MDMIRNHKHYARHIFMGLVYKTRHFTDSGILLKYYGKKGEMYMGDIKDVLEIISKINIPWYLKAGIAVIIIILLVIGLLLKGYRQYKNTARDNSNEIKQDWNNLSTKDKIVKVIIIIAVLIIVIISMFATVYKGNIIKNLIMDCQSYTKYRPNETTGGIFVSWRRKEELPTGA